MYFRWLFLIHPTFSAAKRPPIFFLLHPSEENGQRYSRKIEERAGVSDRWPVDRKGWLFVWKTKGREKADLSHGKARFKKEMLDFLLQRMDMDGYSWRRKRFFWQRLGENRFGILKKGKTWTSEQVQLELPKRRKRGWNNWNCNFNLLLYCKKRKIFSTIISSFVDGQLT